MKYKIDYYKVFVFCAIALTLFGFYMVNSASLIWAEFKYGDKFYFTKRQLLFMVVGFIMMFVFSKIDTLKLRKHTKKILIAIFILLILVIIPGIGVERNGSRSWFGIGSFAIQPAELFKIAIILYVADKLDLNYIKTKDFKKGIIPILIPGLLGFLLIMIQPDFGSGVVIVLSIILMTLVSRNKISNYVKLGIVGIMGLGALIISAPYRLSRIMAFIDPFSDPLGSGFQTIQSLYAIGPGGLLGIGINGSIQKHFYLPEPQTDFIFAIVCEEFGFVGSVLLILLFIAFFYAGFKIVLNSVDDYQCLVSFGFISLIGVQTLMNLGVVVGLLPVTGITLPFISYGGSSLVVILSMVGIIYGFKEA
ncbi:MAG: putative lipid II flippase FtsW [Bacilli bacterium]|nr:putative lipid II flippase FtsW [Bacilli bacterium]